MRRGGRQQLPPRLPTHPLSRRLPPPAAPSPTRPRTYLPAPRPRRLPAASGPQPDPRLARLPSQVGSSSCELFPRPRSTPSTRSPAAYSQKRSPVWGYGCLQTPCSGPPPPRPQAVTEGPPTTPVTGLPRPQLPSAAFGITDGRTQIGAHHDSGNRYPPSRGGEPQLPPVSWRGIGEPKVVCEVQRLARQRPGRQPAASFTIPRNLARVHPAPPD